VPASALVDWNREQTPDYDVHGNFPVALLLGGRAWGKDILPPGPLQAAQPREPEDAATYSHIGGSVIHGDVTFRDGTFVGGSQTTTTNYYSTLAGQPVAAAPDPGLGLEGLFAELRTAVASAPLHARAEAEAAVEALQWEVEKGPQADDKVMAGLVKKLADLAPATGPTLSLLFATPPLSGLAGNATQFVLDLIKQN
jgi:hypothetical protein